LPQRLATALSTREADGSSLWQQRRWRTCAISESAREYPCPATRQTLVEAGAAISCGTGTAYNALIRLNQSARHTIAIAEAYRLFDQGAGGKGVFLI